VARRREAFEREVAITRAIEIFDGDLHLQAAFVSGWARKWRSTEFGEREARLRQVPFKGD
jgi:hypothetical protein